MFTSIEPPSRRGYALLHYIVKFRKKILVTYVGFTYIDKTYGAVSL
jgi:hypothetical protein